MGDSRMLELRNISARYDTLDVLHQISLEVHTRELVSIIGANGAGKTTVLQIIAGFLRPHEGSVFMNGRSVGRWTPERIGRGLVAYVPQGRLLFANQSVHANLLLGGYWHRKDKERLRRGQARVYELFPALARNQERPAGALSAGEQQMLAIGRAIMSDAAILVLDEPSLGMAPEVTSALYTALSRLVASGCSVLTAERQADQALAASSRCYVLRTGRIAYEGPSAALQESPETLGMYFGKDLAGAN